MLGTQAWISSRSLSAAAGGLASGGLREPWNRQGLSATLTAEQLKELNLFSRRAGLRLLAFLNYTRRTPVHARSPVILCGWTRFVARAPCGKSTAVIVEPVYVLRRALHAAGSAHAYLPGRQVVGAKVSR